MRRGATKEVSHRMGTWGRGGAEMRFLWRGGGGPAGENEVVVGCGGFWGGGQWGGERRGAEALFLSRFIGPRQECRGSLWADGGRRRGPD